MALHEYKSIARVARIKKHKATVNNPLHWRLVPGSLQGVEYPEQEGDLNQAVYGRTAY